MRSKRKRSDSATHQIARSPCDVCTSMTASSEGLASLTSPDGYKHHSRAQLESSASQGCPCCSMLLAKAMEEWSVSTGWDLRIRALDEKGTYITARPGNSGFGEQKLGLLRCKKRAGNDTAVFDLYVSAGRDSASRFVSNKSTSTDFESTQITRKIQEWLMECEAHEKCPMRNSPLLPTRVIFVGESSEDVRLYKSKTGERGDYIALSYCWGGRQALTTTLETIDRNTKALDVSSLPRTLYDAVLTTRRMGFEYLWVDALCIIQDSNEDRTWEIGRMGDVYKNATLTIVAASSSTVAGGFLNPRPSPEDFLLPLATLNGDIGTISLTPKEYGLQPREPLYSRAWALQEFLLSPRLLIFGTREVIWQCTELISPVLPSHRSYDPNWPCKRIPMMQHAPVPQLISPALTSKPDQLTLRTRCNIWQSIVQDYTSRNLTMPEDRLPALAGIARELENTWGDIYIAGMWRSDLLSWLLWRSEPKAVPAPSGEAQPKSVGWRAPSWSWASVDGVVTFHWCGGTELSLSAKIIYVDEQQQHIGAVPGQRLFLEASIVPLKNLQEVRDEYKGESLHRPLRVEDDEGIEDDGTLKFALLGFNYVSAFGLIVKQTGDGKDKFGTFVRVGMLCTWLPKEPSWWPKKKRRLIIM